jgi:hypothetical protein
VNKALTLKPDYGFLKKFKLISNNENYSKFNISLTLGLKIIKSPLGNPIYQAFPIVPKVNLNSRIFWF